jgi:two-component system, NtrC family, sensor histidine kinase HydH
MTDGVNQVFRSASPQTEPVPVEVRQRVAQFVQQSSDEISKAADELAAAWTLCAHANRNDAGQQVVPVEVALWLRRWLVDILRGEEDTTDPISIRFGQQLARSNVTVEHLFTALMRVRRNLVTLALRAQTGTRPDFELADAIALALDDQLRRTLQACRAELGARAEIQERLAAIGQLVGAVGHELRNPLSTIETSAYALSQRLDAQTKQDPWLRKHTERIRHQVRVAANTVASLLALAKRQLPDCATHDIESAVRTALVELKYPEAVEVRVDVRPGQTVQADIRLLHIVLVNLFANAISAVGDRGAIMVRAVECSGGIELFVSDDGPGILPEFRDRIFDALYTTKPNGTGLGLAVCRQIVSAHGGEIELQPSEVGATFRLWFPGPGSMK